MSDYTLIHNEKECQYEYHIEGHLAQLVYDDQDGVLYITHTLVPKSSAAEASQAH